MQPTCSYVGGAGRLVAQPIEHIESINGRDKRDVSLHSNVYVKTI